MTTASAPAVAASTGEIIEGVPWYQQTNEWYDGHAALQMVFDFYGPYIDQREIGYVTYDVPTLGFSLEDTVRAGHFSDLSVVDVPGCKIVGYTGRGLGYAAFGYGSSEPWLDGLRALIDQGYPVIVYTWFSLETVGQSDKVPPSLAIGHCLVVVGYDDTTKEVIVQDPWGREYKHEADFHGSMMDNPAYDSDFAGTRLGYEYFNQLWTYSTYLAFLITPWHVDIGLSGTGTELTVTAKVTYPCPAPFNSYQYPAQDVQVGITLPDGLALAPGEPATKDVGGLSAGGTADVTWSVVASHSGSYGVSVLAQGLVHGYLVSGGTAYTDRIGGEAAASIVVAV